MFVRASSASRFSSVPIKTRNGAWRVVETEGTQLRRICKEGVQGTGGHPQSSPRFLNRTLRNAEEPQGSQLPPYFSEGFRPISGFWSVGLVVWGGFRFTFYKKQGFKSPNHQYKPPIKGWVPDHWNHTRSSKESQEHLPHIHKEHKSDLVDSNSHNPPNRDQHQRLAVCGLIS